MRKLGLVDGMVNGIRMASLKEARTILVFDTSNMAHKYARQQGFKDMSYNGQKTGHVFGTIRGIQAFARKSPGPVAMVFALDGYAKRRYRLYPRYKGNRDRSGEDPIPAITRLVKMLPGYHIHLPDWEADDAIASFVAAYQERKGTGTIRIVTGDHDLWQLVGPGVTWWRASGEPPMDTEAIHEEGFDVAEVLLRKVLFGDSSDNIQGVPRLNSEAAEPLIQESGGSLKAFIRLARETHPAIALRVKAHMPVIHRNKQLIRLRVKPITPIRNSADKAAVEAMVIHDYGCKSLQGDLDKLFPGDTDAGPRPIP